MGLRLILTFTLCLPLAVHASNCDVDNIKAAQKAFSQIAATEEKNLEKSPYRYACQGKYDLYKRPIASLGAPELNIEDKYGQTSFNFMQPLATAITDSAFENWSSWDSLEKCLTTMRDDPNCRQAMKELRQVLIPYIAEARQHLALAFDPSPLAMGKTMELNSNLENLDSYKNTEWEPLNAQEKSHAQGILQKYIQESRTSTDSSLPLQKRAEMIEKKIKSVRMRHMIKYQALLSQSSLLSYLKSPNPTDKELLAAVTKLKDASMEELLMLKKAKESLEKNHQVTPDSLVFLKYKNFVEGQLWNDPHSCGLATYLKDAAGNRDTTIKLAISLPLMAASLIAPPLIPGTAGFLTSVGLTAAAGAATVIPLQNDLDSARRRIESRFTNAFGQDMQDTQERVQMLDESFQLEANVTKLKKEIKSTAPGPERDALMKELETEKDLAQESHKLQKSLTEDNKELSVRERNRNLGIAFAILPAPPTLIRTAKNPLPIIQKLAQMKALLKQVAP